MFSLLKCLHPKKAFITYNIVIRWPRSGGDGGRGSANTSLLWRDYSRFFKYMYMYAEFSTISTTHFSGKASKLLFSAENNC